MRTIPSRRILFVISLILCCTVCAQEEKEFNVSKSQYLKTNIGDSRRVCIRKSLLGLEYYSVHE